MTSGALIDTPAGDRVFALGGGLSASFAVGLGLAIAIEGVVLHLWIAPKSQLWAWAIAALNALTLVWLWWEHRSAARSRLIVTPSDIEIDAGSRLRCRFPRSLIASAEAGTWRSVPDLATDFVNTAQPLDPNVILVLREPLEARIALGIRKRVSRIGIHVADASAVQSLFQT